MKTNYLYLLVLLLLLENCSSYKKGLGDIIGKDEIIKSSILDYSNKSRIYKKGTVFYVAYYDNLKKMILEESNDGNSKWVKGGIYKEIIAVSILINPIKVLLTDDIKVGEKGNNMPTRYLEKNGKLFYWYDDDFPLTQETLDVFSKYNLLQDNEGGWVTSPDLLITDSQKAVDYYYCKNNFSKNKKITTNVGIGFYDAPKLNCSE